MKKIITISAFFISLLFIIQCNLFKSITNESLAKVLIKPPFALKIVLKKIEADKKGRNLIVKATFDKSEVSKKFFFLKVGDDKIFYHDDGIGDDEIKDDGVYTAKMKVDFDELTKFAEDNNRFTVQNVLSFRHRQIVGKQPANRINLSAFASGQEITLNQAIPFDSKLRDHSLMITDPSVIEDPARTLVFKNNQWIGTPNGVWTFGYLMRQMANQSLTNVTPEAFTLQWLQTWERDTIINGDNSRARKQGIDFLISNWPKKAGSTDLDLDKAPFKLLAIVNRVDLMGKEGYGGSMGDKSSGEGRFVFNVFDKNGFAQLFNVIFEYGYKFDNVNPLRDYQKKWASLKDKNFGTPDFNNTLESLTHEFSDANKNPSKPNKNCIDQVRTNEIALGSVWELREFHLDNTSHLLKQVSPNREPQTKYNAQTDNADVRELVKWVNDNSSNVATVEFNTKLLAASAINSGSVVWNGIQVPNPPQAFITKDDDRFDLAINTCSGCHGFESGSGFTQVNTDGSLSLFLTGNGFNQPHNVTDAARRPQLSPKVRGFNDLDNRGQILNNFAQLPPAISMLLIEPVTSSD